MQKMITEVDVSESSQFVSELAVNWLNTLENQYVSKLDIYSEMTR